MSCTCFHAVGFGWLLSLVKCFFSSSSLSASLSTLLVQGFYNLYQQSFKTQAVLCALFGRYLFRACQESLLDALLPGACQRAASQRQASDFPLVPLVKLTLCFSSYQSCHNFSYIPSANGMFSYFIPILEKQIYQYLNQVINNDLIGQLYLTKTFLPEYSLGCLVQ